MVSTLSRGALRPCAGLLPTLLAVTLLVAGCVRMVDGAAHGVAPGVAVRAPMALADLLIDPERFPGRYPAATLAPAEAVQAIRDIDGTQPGAEVDPPQCVPPAPPAAAADAVAVQGADPDTSSTLTVVLTRTETALTTRRDQLGRCPSFTTAVGETGTDITVTLLAQPPVDADDTYAAQQHMSDSAGGARHALVLAGQIADVRITAAWIGADDVTPDTEALDNVFTDAVLTVRREGLR